MEAQTPHCLSVCLFTGCEELLKDVLSVESAGTLPCSPDITDCVEQVRAAASAPASLHYPLHLHPGSALEGLEGLGLLLMVFWHQSQKTTTGLLGKVAPASNPSPQESEAGGLPQA